MCDSPVHWLDRDLADEYYHLSDRDTRTDASLHVYGKVMLEMNKFYSAVQAGHLFEQYADAAAEMMRPGDVGVQEAWRKAMAASAEQIRARGRREV